MIDKIFKDIKGLIKIDSPKDFLINWMPYILIFYIGNIFSKHVASYVGGDVIDRILIAILEVNTMSLLPIFKTNDLIVGLVLSGLVKLIVYSKGKNAKKFRQGEEYGSARWGTKKDIEPYIDEKFENNVLLTQTERLTMDSRPSNPKYARNKNVMVIGGSGSGKTRFYVKPNLMQMHSSYIVYVGTQTIQPGIEDMLREKNDGGKPVRWASLQRSGSNSRRFEGPTMFYPIFFNKDDKSFHSTGESLPLNLDRNTVIAPEGTIAVFPLGRNNDERNWQLSQKTFNERLSRGFVKFGKWNEAKNSRSISYLSTGVINRIASGELKILGYEQDGAAIIENVSTIRPVSTWNKPTHSASEYGSSLLNHIMPDRKFPFPKSLYAVADTLKFFVSNKKDALILDFFAGSGTTAHAVNLLNKEDGGKRQSIMVTNNEVSVDESKSLKKKGFNPGDIEWEDLGIAHHITWPRIKCSILGIDTVGSPLTDTYKITRKKQVLVPRKIKKIDYVTPETLDTVTKRKNFVSNLNSKYSDLAQSLVKKDEPFIVSDEHSTTIIFDIEYLEEWLNEIEGKDHIQNFLIITNNNKEFNNIKDKVADLMGENQSIIEEELPMSKGFDTNAIFFKLGFLDKNSVAIGKQLSELLPLLWMKAGSVGECPSIGENENVDALIYPKNKFGILIKENRFADFKNELDEYPEINTVFIVTDSDEGYVEMSSLLEVKQTFQLYKDYLDNFRINIRR